VPPLGGVVDEPGGPLTVVPREATQSAIASKPGQSVMDSAIPRPVTTRIGISLPFIV
jgi:hypothetical protein